MKDRILKLSELLEVDSEVHKNKIDVWKAFFLTITLGFTGYHWFFLKQKKLGIARIALTVITVIATVIVIFGIIPKELGMIIILLLILASLAWTTVDLFRVNKMSIENDKKHEAEALKRITSGKNEN